MLLKRLVMSAAASTSVGAVAIALLLGAASVLALGPKDEKKENAASAVALTLGALGVGAVFVVTLIIGRDGGDVAVASEVVVDL